MNLSLPSPMLLLSLLIPIVQAAVPTPTYDARALTQVYEAIAEKKGEQSVYLEKRLTEERGKVKALAEREVKLLIADIEKGEEGNPSNQKSAVEKQQALVTLLEEQLRDRKVDIEIMHEAKEELAQGASSATGATALGMVKSAAEAKAKTAILEERITVLQTNFTLESDRLEKLIQSERMQRLWSLLGTIVYPLIIVAAVLLDRFIRKRFVRNIEDKNRRYIVGKLVSFSITIATIIIVLGRLLIDHPGALASFAIIGAAIAVGMQDMVKDIAGWMIILQRKLYTLGNRIAVGPYVGDVVDISLLRTTLLEVSNTLAPDAHERVGKVLTLPNALVLREPVLNYSASSDYVHVKLPITITYQSDYRKAEKILKECLLRETSQFVVDARKQMKRRTAFFFTAWDVPEPSVHVDLGEHGIHFSLNFIVPLGMKRVVMTTLSHAILERFALERDVSLAYNTIQIVGSTSSPHS